QPLGTAESLAYVMYTSGSTGRPKGVMLEHKALTNRFAYLDKLTRLKEGDWVPCIASFAFDISVVETLFPLSCGAGIRVIDDETINNIEELHRNLQDTSFVHMVPSLLAVWLDYIRESNTHTKLPNLRLLATGGEKVPEELIKSISLVLPKVDVAQFYGPTEAAIFGVCQEQGRLFPNSLGRSIVNTRVRLLDCLGGLSAPGTTGEIAFSGVSLARGYLNQPKLTREKFILRRDGLGNTEKLYKTGDLSSLDEDQFLVFRGRNDDQIKLRGIRIELAEIEQCVRDIEEIREVVIMLDQSDGNNPVLIAFITGDEAVLSQHTDLTAYLKDKLSKLLPDIMTPAHFYLLQKLPTNVNGKLDKKKLEKDLVHFKPASVDTVVSQPETDTETKLQHMCADLLGQGASELCLSRSFFELGGNSLLVMKLLPRIQEQFDCNISVKVIFEQDSVRTLAAHIDKERQRTSLLERLEQEGVEEEGWL
ncbi:non-ribosomal peptide synthetase, partial [Pseudoalteromonas sp. 2CM41L]|uniref:non-ribosomal peptide synthetase n=1 Tax=Pseudoalteromonas sp. 2CM41L TaxID=2929857 RepID=UPI0020BEFF31